MLKNYLLIAYRTLKRNKGYTFINVVGLAVGMACCILIGLYVLDELSYDRFHEKADRIYRVVAGNKAATPPPVAPTLESQYPTLVEHVVRLWPIKAPATVRYEDKVFAERGITFADPAVFDVFSYPMRAGDPKQALAAPQTMVLTASMARKYFGDENPIGKTLQFWGESYEVTGVIDDVPSNTHYPFDALVSFSSLPFSEMLDNWTWAGFYTYVLLQENVSPAQLEAALRSLADRHIDESVPVPRLQALTDIHLYSNLDQEAAPGGNVAYVYLLATIALLVLGVACINFMNLSTARSADRAKEVGMRKTFGAHRGQLIGQFLGESVLLSGAALLVALVLVELALPSFNHIAGKTLVLHYGAHGEAVFALIGLALVVGLGAGSYPALFLSRFQPAPLLKSRRTPRTASLPLRQGLVVFQFAVSIALFIGAVVVHQQLGYLQSKDLGFDQEHVLVMEAGNYGPLMEELHRTSGIAGVAAAGEVPGHRFQVLPVRTDGMPGDSIFDMRILGVDYGFIETMGIGIAEGRSFSREQGTDARHAFMLNEAAARALGWREATGKNVALYGFSEDGTTFEVRKEGTVVGVTEDFNYASLHGRVEPLLIHVTTGEDINYVLARLQPGNVRTTLAQIEAAWHEANPDDPFDYFFLGDRLSQQYQAEQQLSRVFGGFTALALFIACLGLFGLAAHAAERRTKEIGIRKVLGASVPSVVTLLSKDFLKLVLVAFVIAAPVAYYAMSRWLEDFAYRIDLGPGVFLLAGTAALLIALVTVSYQALRAALANPTEALRAE